MREEAALLEDIADAPLCRAQEDARLGIHQHAAAERDAACVWPQQARDQVDQRGLARAGWAKQGGDAATRLEAHRDLEGAEPFMDIDIQRHVRSPARNRAASHSASSMAPIAITIETRVRRSAPVSPSGDWISA